ncbi:DnaJ domain-containing protein, partial [Elsinoe ampelina]
MPSDDLESHARSTQDYYALLEIAEGATESEIRKAYRRTALKYHPDKNAGNAAAVDKFHLLSVANDVLSDPHAKAIYDSGRQARREKELREQAYGDERRRMKEDLERKERGGKRTREEDEEYEKQQAELRRLQADGARRRYERQEKLRKEQEDALKAEEAEQMELDDEPADVPEMERAVKVKWERDGEGQNIDKDSLAKMFERFGKVDMVVVLKDKTKTKKGTDTKRVLGTATVVFVSMASAHAAV